MFSRRPSRSYFIPVPSHSLTHSLDLSNPGRFDYIGENYGQVTGSRQFGIEDSWLMIDESDG